MVDMNKENREEHDALLGMELATEAELRYEFEQFLEEFQDEQDADFDVRFKDYAEAD
jgi:hypothetical protein